MKIIPTAEKLFDDFYNQQQENGTSDGAIWEYKNDIIKIMNDYAKFHVTQALKKASEKLPYDDRMNRDILVLHSILNAYPLTLIK